MKLSLKAEYINELKLFNDSNLRDLRAFIPASLLETGSEGFVSIDALLEEYRFFCASTNVVAPKESDSDFLNRLVLTLREFY